MPVAVESSTSCLSMTSNKTYDGKIRYTISGIQNSADEPKQLLQSGIVRSKSEAEKRMKELASQHHKKICTPEEARRSIE